MEPQNSVTRYTVMKPGSGSQPVCVGTVSLFLPKPSQGGLDGLVLGMRGQKEFIATGESIEFQKGL
ncbi:MAG TPA: hypothetical protein VJ385_10235 [Fibrobacteria bacterium]|nr:hypothetical protein [Fibrobacteria bacterium]